MSLYYVLKGVYRFMEVIRVCSQVRKWWTIYMLYIGYCPRHTVSLHGFTYGNVALLVSYLDDCKWHYQFISDCP